MKKIKLLAYELAKIDTPSRVWVADYIDKLAGYKTKLERVEFDPIKMVYTFHVSKFKNLNSDTESLLKQ